MIVTGKPYKTVGYAECMVCGFIELWDDDYRDHKECDKDERK